MEGEGHDFRSERPKFSGPRQTPRQMEPSGIPGEGAELQGVGRSQERGGLTEDTKERQLDGGKGRATVSLGVQEGGRFRAEAVASFMKEVESEPDAMGDPGERGLERPAGSGGSEALESKRDHQAGTEARRHGGKLATEGGEVETKKREKAGSVWKELATDAKTSFGNVCVLRRKRQS